MRVINILTRAIAAIADLGLAESMGALSMGTRETYTEKLACPKCGTAGSAKLEENANPLHRGNRLDRKVIEISGPFQTEPKLDAPIRFARCDVVVLD